MKRTTAVDLVRLITVGHGLLDAETFAAHLRGTGVVSVVDVRTAPGSRRNPAFGRAELERWLPPHGAAYRWEPRLGGFRRPEEDSPNVALRHAGFRGYADHMRSPEFARALDGVVAEARQLATDPRGGGDLASVMCSESVWWRCHRRLLADAAVLLRRVEVDHLMPDGRVMPHRLTTGVRVGHDGLLVYDRGADRLPGT
jgi:uncharacterized protein (DUF488 family)